MFGESLADIQRSGGLGIAHFVVSDEISLGVEYSYTNQGRRCCGL